MENLLLVKSSNGESFEKDKYYREMNRYINSYSGSQSMLAELNLGQKIITSVCMSACLILSGLGVVDGSLTPGDVIFLQSILGMSFAPLFNMGNMYIKFQESLVE